MPPKSAHSGRDLVVAYSGGLDSTLLLHCSQRLWPDRVRAIHVNHSLQPAAEAWAEHCRATCLALNIPLHVATPTLASGASLEAQARTARYQVFTEQLGANDVLLMAHHQDDQLETVLFRLVRGSGIDGLAGMPPRRVLGAGTLIRPWLAMPQQQLRAAAEALELVWINDPSNADEHHDRNFIRHSVLPLIRQRWPSADTTMARSHHHLVVAADRLAELDRAELEPRQGKDGSLDISGMDNPTVHLPVLRLWLQGQGFAGVTEQQLDRLWHDVVHSAPDRQGEWQLGQRAVRRFGQRLHVLPRLAPLPARGTRLSWDPLHQPVISDPTWGQLLCTPAQPGEESGVCLDPERLQQALGKEPLHVVLRQGGESLHPAGRNHSRDLKRLLQECKLPPWWRARVPLLYWQTELVAVGDLLVARGWQAPAGNKVSTSAGAPAKAGGYQLVWKKPAS